MNREVARRRCAPAAKEPCALIVRDAGGMWAIDRDAVRVTLEALREQVPGLGTALAAM